MHYLNNHTHFDSFDRTYFVREKLVPLYRTHVQFRKQLLGLYPKPASTLRPALNWDEEFLFSSELINPFAYSKLNEAQFNSALTEFGEFLFFEKRLSSRGDLSCASCHLPDQAFQDGKPTSFGVRSEQALHRNTPTLLNAALSPSFLWDNSVEQIENQFIHVFKSDVEFATTYLEMEKRISQDSTFQRLRSNAFGETNVHFKNEVDAALAAYVISLSSFNSTFDQFMEGKGELSEDAQEGFNLFMGKAACATCHFAPTFSGLVPPYFDEMEGEVLGVTTEPLKRELDPDDGKYGASVANDIYFQKNMFKTVTVRNVAQTGPYMHNGAFPTLREVVEFYNHGGGQGLGLDLPHQTLPGDSLNLTELEIEQLVSFMESLNSMPRISL